MNEVKFVKKDWGHEKWFANTPDYCGKELFVKQSVWSSDGNYHYHKIKDETFYIIEGNLVLNYVGTDNLFRNIKLRPGSAFRVPPLIKHRFTTYTWGGCTFIEASTHHEDSDSYRCYFNKQKGDWVDV